MAKKQNNKKTKYILLATGLLLVTGMGSYILFQAHYKDKPYLQDTIKYAPPTEEEQKETASHKEHLVEQMKREANQTPQEPGVRKSVTPVISYWGQSKPGESLELGGFVQGIIEEGGECRLVLEKREKEVTETLTSKKDATSTSCSPFVVQRSLLEAGQWNAKLSYSSATSVGVSNQITIKVE